MSKALSFLGLISVILFGFAAQSFAQNPLPSNNSNQPLEITAQGYLEWRREEQKFIADKDAVATQGDVSISAATLTALYRDNDQNDLEIWQVEADQNVVIDSRETNAYGDKAIYNIDEELATMTGDNLRLVSPDQVVTASDKFEYFVVEGRLNAIGDAKMERTNERGERNVLQADKISAVLKDNEKGERVLDTLEAFDHVIITTPTDVVTGDYGIYRSATSKAEITGNVTITRGPNILQGSRAEVDMTTNTSKIFGGAGSSTGQGRVRGVFYPGSQDKEE